MCSVCKKVCAPEPCQKQHRPGIRVPSWSGADSRGMFHPGRRSPSGRGRLAAGAGQARLQVQRQLRVAATGVDFESPRAAARRRVCQREAAAAAAQRLAARCCHLWAQSLFGMSATALQSRQLGMQVISVSSGSHTRQSAAWLLTGFSAGLEELRRSVETEDSPQSPHLHRKQRLPVHPALLRWQRQTARSTPRRLRWRSPSLHARDSLMYMSSSCTLTTSNGSTELWTSHAVAGDSK